MDTRGTERWTLSLLTEDETLDSLPYERQQKSGLLAATYNAATNSPLPQHPIEGPHVSPRKGRQAGRPATRMDGFAGLRRRSSKSYRTTTGPAREIPQSVVRRGRDPYMGRCRPLRGFRPGAVAEWGRMAAMPPARRRPATAPEL